MNLFFPMFLTLSVYQQGHTIGMNFTVYKRQRIPQGESKIDNPEKLATQGTQDEGKQSKNTTQYVLLTKHK